MAPPPGTRTLACAIFRDRDALSADARGPRLVHACGASVLLRDALLIGRSRASGLRLRRAEVSRVHAAIVATDGGFAVEDRSKNGLRVNGRKVRGRAPVAPGDVVRVGTARLRVVDAPPAPRPAPPAPRDERRLRHGVVWLATLALAAVAAALAT